MRPRRRHAAGDGLIALPAGERVEPDDPAAAPLQPLERLAHLFRRIGIVAIGEDDDDTDSGPDNSLGASTGSIGRQTMAMVLDAVDKANARAANTAEEAIEAVVGASKASQKRVFMIVIVVLMLLAAVIGVTASIELPDGTSIGFDPDKPTDAPAEGTEE